jgi:hypothetical protein
MAMGYYNYRDVQGQAAVALSTQMSIRNPLRYSGLGCLVEIREALNHIQLVARDEAYRMEVHIFHNRTLEIIKCPIVFGTALKTVYEPDGRLRMYHAAWSREKGYLEAYRLVRDHQNIPDEASKLWEKYNRIYEFADMNAKRPTYPNTRPLRKPAFPFSLQ